MERRKNFLGSKEFAPKEFKRIVEPFCGGSAVALHYGDICVLNDINKAVINLYRQIGSDNYPTIQRRIDEIKTYDHDELEKVFYSSRDIINDPDDYSDLEYAIAYIVVRQLCFSGMERYNSEGKFNVPFGHYKKMSCNHLLTIITSLLRKQRYSIQMQLTLLMSVLKMIGYF